ncbi:hypothetical protein NP681_004501 [Salmonella enterica]|nr:hypothetical protein [Salmonella enterica]EJR3519426.1 hypothetical protein [Salmonella enterica]
MGNHDNKDLFDFVKYSFRNYIFVLTVTVLTIITGAVFCFIHKEEYKVNIEVRPKIFPPYFYASCLDEVECKNKMFEEWLLSIVGHDFDISTKRANNVFLLTASFNNALPPRQLFFLSSLLRSEIKKWYIYDIEHLMDEFKNLNDCQKSTEILNRILLMIPVIKKFLNKDDIIFISNPVCLPLYNATLVFIASVISGLMISILCLYVKYLNINKHEN